MAFTSPGDLVLDPFVGGGTSVVESLALGRRAVGTDLNELAVFVTRAKTTLVGARENIHLLDWAAHLDATTTRAWHQQKQLADQQLDARVPWQLRKSLQLALESAEELSSDRLRLYARASLLSLGQWALDGRRNIPSRREFLAKHADLVASLLAGSFKLKAMATTAFGISARRVEQSRRVHHAPAHTVKHGKMIPYSWGAPRLVLTSPPYHGIHMLYHRWQVEGRRETNAPYWVSGCNDGRPASYYTFGSRSRPGETGIREDYFANALRSFQAIHAVCDGASTVVQLVGFSNPATQLPRYLTMMREAGFNEALVNHGVSGVSRSVPNRKWYLEALQRFGPSDREFLLVHRRAT
jgi:hypothetical protein